MRDTSVSTQNSASEHDLMDKIVSLAKRKGFIFRSAEIYGGLNGFFDYGPLGVELKRNIKDAWWKEIVEHRDNVVGLDCSIVSHSKVTRWLIVKSQRCDSGQISYFLQTSQLMVSL